MAWVNLTEYALHRGVSHQRISTLIKQGKLKRATKKKGKRTLINQAKADIILARRIDPSWDQQSKLLKKGVGKTEASFHEAKKAHETFKAALAKLDLEQKTGKLISAEQVRLDWAEVGKVIRDAILNIPDRISPIVAAETDPAEVNKILTRELRQALEELGRDHGGGSAS